MATELAKSTQKFPLDVAPQSMHHCRCSKRSLSLVIGWLQLSFSLVSFFAGIIYISNVSAVLQNIQTSPKHNNGLVLHYLRFEGHLFGFILICRGICSSLLAAVVIMSVHNGNVKLIKDWWIIHAVFVFIFILPFLLMTGIKVGCEIAIIFGTIELVIAVGIVIIFRAHAKDLTKKEAEFRV